MFKYEVIFLSIMQIAQKEEQIFLQPELLFWLYISS